MGNFASFAKIFLGSYFGKGIVNGVLFYEKKLGSKPYFVPLRAFARKWRVHGSVRTRKNPCFPR
jgi:hypothetical protein